MENRFFRENWLWKKSAFWNRFQMDEEDPSQMSDGSGDYGEELLSM